MDVTVTSTKLIIDDPAGQIVFNGQDIIRAVGTIPAVPALNTAPVQGIVTLSLTGSAREVFGETYVIRLAEVYNQPTWVNNTLAGALQAAEDIRVMIRSASGGGGGGQVDSVVAGDAIDVDSTDPVNPIVNVKVDGVTIGFNGSNELEVPAGGGGYVVGPGSATDDHVVLFDGASGNLIKDSGYTPGDLVIPTGFGDIDLIETSAGFWPVEIKGGLDGDATEMQSNTGSFQVNVKVDGTTIGINGSNELESLVTDTGITQLTGDVTAGPGSGSQAATLASVIAAGGPTGSATVAPIITYDAKGRLTTVSSATITPAVGSITGLGTGVATALGNNADSASGFVTQAGGDARYRTPYEPEFITWASGPVARGSTSLGDVTDAYFDLPVGLNHVVFHIIHDAAAATTGAWWSLNGTATFDFLSAVVNGAASQGDNPIRCFNAFDGGSAITSTRFTTGNEVVVDAWINVTVAGTIQLRFASEVAGSAITVTALTGFRQLL